MGWVINVTPRPLYPRERDPVLTVQEAGWAPGPVGTGGENLALTGIGSPDHPACSDSQYRLRHPDSRISTSTWNELRAPRPEIRGLVLSTDFSLL